MSLGELVDNNSCLYNKFRDTCFRPRWMMNNVSSNTSSSMPFDTPTSSALANELENLI